MNQPVDSSKKRTDDPGHGWFVIPGIQTGERTLETQLEHLEPLLVGAEIGKYTILDLGCAEGLVGMAFSRRGSGHVTGIESVASRVMMARRLANSVNPRLDADFMVGDLEKLDFPAMQPRDVVLALSIAQKMPDPERWMQQIGTLARKYLVLRLPDVVIKDRRSAFREISPHATLASDFRSVHEGRNSLGEYLMVFQRR